MTKNMQIKMKNSKLQM